MEQTISKIVKLSHKQFRAMLKKFRRKKKRQDLAQERERQELIEQRKRESSPNYKERQEELRRNIELYEQFEERESMRKNKMWLLREQQAQVEFKRKQHQLEQEKIRREEERKRILEEFEKQQFVENRATEENKKIKSQKEEVLQVALSNLAEEDGPWHNPIAPEHYNTGIEREQCMFFSKTGCCRFGDRCSRGHTRPDVSRTILIRGMYSHFSIGQTASDDYDTDIALEYEDNECYQHFKNFYNDVLPEFKKFGRVNQFKVCSNFEAHLRGNVYIQFSRDQEAVEAYQNFNGRYYAGKQLTCEFTNISRWKAAICGLYGKKMCPKGINCNFLHVFRNPNDEFWESDRDLPPRIKNHGYHSSRSRDNKMDDRHNRHSSEHRHRHEYKNSRYGPRSERHDRHESRSNRYEPRSDRYESRSDSYESRSDRYESRNDRYGSQSDRYESQSDRHESRRDKYDSKSERYESSNYHDNKISESDTDSSGDDHSKSSAIKNDSFSSQSKKRHRNSRSRSKSPSEILNGSASSSKKKKHKKKKSKKNKRDFCSDDDN